MAEAPLPADAYGHSRAHYFLAVGDIFRLLRFLDSLPRLAHPSAILTESDSLHQSHLADQISSVIDRRDVPHRDSPLHLAVRLLPLSAAESAVSALTLAGADPSLPNSSGWTPLHIALSTGRRHLAVILLRHHRLSAWSKLRRRLPFLLPALRSIPDFNLHISLRFESPLLPFIPRSAIPSDDIRLYKCASDVRADRRRSLSFLFLSNPENPDLPFGSLLVLDRDRKEIRDAFDGAEDESDAEAIVGDSTAYRPGIDIANARLVPCTNWRRREKIETVGDWKTRVYELQNVVFSFKTLAVTTEEERLPELKLDENVEEGFIVADLGNVPARHSCYERGSFGRAEEMEISGRRSVDGVASGRLGVRSCLLKSKEKEVVKNLKPIVWLTEDFPLKIEELLPILDILANKIKAVRQLRELLTTKFPPGTFPVKVAIPIVPTVRMIITFTEFSSLQPAEKFFTPLSSPRLLSFREEEEEDHGKPKSLLKRSSNSVTAKSSIFRSTKTSNPHPQPCEYVNPFIIPNDYKWVSFRDQSLKVKVSKLRKGKQRGIG